MRVQNSRDGRNRRKVIKKDVPDVNNSNVAALPFPDNKDRRSVEGGCMKRFILSDLHIGYPNVQDEAIDEVIKYITREAKGGDEIWGLGDWFHIKEMG
jgi:hypothetical protein